MYSTPSKRISKGWTSSLSTTSAICWQSSNSVTLRWTPTTSFSCTTRAWTQKTFSVQLMQFRLFSLLQHRGLKLVCLQSPAQQESCTLPVQPGLGLEKSGCCSQTHHSSCTTHLNSQFPPVKGRWFVLRFSWIGAEHPAWHPVLNVVLIHEMQCCSLSLLGLGTSPSGTQRVLKAFPAFAGWHQHHYPSRWLLMAEVALELGQFQ